MIQLTNKEKNILNLALEQLDKYYDEKESICRQFKWICHDYLPQVGEDYVKNINVFDIESKTIKDIQQAKKEGRNTIMKLINN